MGYLYDISLGDLSLCALGMLEPGHCILGADEPPVSGGSQSRKEVRTMHSCFAKTGEALNLKYVVLILVIL